MQAQQTVRGHILSVTNCPPLSGGAGEVRMGSAEQCFALQQKEHFIRHA